MANKFQVWDKEVLDNLDDNFKNAFLSKYEEIVKKSDTCQLIPVFVFWIDKISYGQNFRVGYFENFIEAKMFYEYLYNTYRALYDNRSILGFRVELM